MSAADRCSVGRPDQFKPKASRETEATRRREALTSQQSVARESRVSDVRRIALDALLGGEHVNDLEVEVEIEEEDDDAFAGAETVDVDMAAVKKADKEKTQRLRRLHRTLFFARQFQVPECMVEVPDDLAAAWLLMVRPEGDRCLFLSNDGHVEIRRKNGYVLERYSDSRLPRGLTILDVVCIEGPLVGVAAGGNGEALTSSSEARVRAEVGGADEPQGPADSVDAEEAAPMNEDPDLETMETEQSRRGGRCGRGYSGRGRGGQRDDGKGGGKGRHGRPRRPQGLRRYAVVDVLIWGDADLCCAEAECRMFWLESRFAELPEKCPRRARALQLVPAIAATPEALHEAYHGDFGFVKDSILFLHRQGHYSMGEAITPLVLMWRDRKLSRFVVDTPDEKGEVLPERQAVVLELRGNGHLRTADRTVVARLERPDDLARVRELTQGGGKGRLLLRCDVADAGVDVAARKLGGLRIVAHVPARSRIWADSWGRVAFQHLHRTGRAAEIAFETVMRAARGGAPPAG